MHRLRGTMVERWSLTGELSCSALDLQLMVTSYVGKPLAVGQQCQTFDLHNYLHASV